MASSSSSIPQLPEWFVTPGVSSTNAILVVDASGSTKVDFPGKYKTVFQTMYEIISNIQSTEFRSIFWNSDNTDNELFKKGVHVCSVPMSKKGLELLFKTVEQKIDNHCLTFPHIGFENIPSDWISKTEQTNIYFITDGQIGPYGLYSQTELHNRLCNSIKKITEQYPLVQIHIITVEPLSRNFDQVESLRGAAGCDVFNIIRNNGLTGHISTFTSYTINNLNGYVHIKKNKPLPGFIPYGANCFSEQYVPEFIQYINEEINNVKTDEDALLKIIQMLSTTLSYLVKDKPQQVKDGIINTISEIFMNTVLDKSFVTYMLNQMIKNESSGSAELYTTYRQRMKDLFKQATDMLLSDVKLATGVTRQVITFPVNNIICSVPSSLATSSIILGGKNYPMSSVKIGSFTVPVLPFEIEHMSPMNQQCLRQWIRCIVSKVYGMSALDDSIIHFVLGIVLKVVNTPDMSPSCIQTFRQLGHVMLMKKRLNVDQTELERLEAGNLPIPNSGRLDQFNGYMNQVNKMLETSFRPMTLWYMLCYALGNEKLYNSQLSHCINDIKLDFGSDFDVTNIMTKANMIKPITYISVPESTMYDYNCLITLEDVSMVGGYKFLQHVTSTGNNCKPNCVLSNEGYKTLLESTSSACPYCYTKLDSSNFELVGPKETFDTNNIYPSDTVNVFTETISQPSTSYQRSYSQPSTSYQRSSGPSLSYAGSSSSYSSNKVAPRTNGILVIMKGTVGSGKSTFTSKLKELCDEKGIVCIIEGTDKYCKTGMSVRVAIPLVTKALLSTNDVPSDKPVIICIDTCGEQSKPETTKFFDVDFSGWNRKDVYVNLNRNKLDGYLAWSLRNVLRRGAVTSESNYWLNPVGASVQVCIDVHTKKSNSLELITEHSPAPITSSYGLTVSSAIHMLNAKADEYEKYLNENDLSGKELSKIVSMLC